MRKTLLSLVIAMAASAPGAFAAGADLDRHNPGAAPADTNPQPSAARPTARVPVGAARMPIMGMMQMLVGENVMAAHTERRIAFLKAELKITETQQLLWNAVAEALRENARAMAEMRPAMIEGSGTLPEKLATREKAISAHLDAIHRVRSAFDPLYATLNSDQQKIADGLMIEPRNILGAGMM